MSLVLPSSMSTAREIGHAMLSVVSALIAAVAGAATAIAEIIQLFGGHVSAIDITGKTTLASATVLAISKGFDSLNDAFRSRAASPPTPTPAPPGSDPATATIQALGRALAGFGSPPPIA